MQIDKSAVAGTLESSDVLVKVAPHSKLEVVISSSVMAQFGDQIREVTDETLRELGVASGTVILDDKGALDCTLRARIRAAVVRSCNESFDWSRA